MVSPQNHSADLQLLVDDVSDMPSLSSFRRDDLTISTKGGDDQSIPSLSSYLSSSYHSSNHQLNESGSAEGWGSFASGGGSVESSDCSVSTYSRSGRSVASAVKLDAQKLKKVTPSATPGNDRLRSNESVTASKAGSAESSDCSISTYSRSARSATSAVKLDSQKLKKVIPSATPDNDRLRSKESVAASKAKQHNLSPPTREVQVAASYYPDLRSIPKRKRSLTAPDDKEPMTENSTILTSSCAADVSAPTQNSMPPLQSKQSGGDEFKNKTTTEQGNAQDSSPVIRNWPLHDVPTVPSMGVASIPKNDRTTRMPAQMDGRSHATNFNSSSSPSKSAIRKDFRGQHEHEPSQQVMVVDSVPRLPRRGSSMQKKQSRGSHRRALSTEYHENDRNHERATANHSPKASCSSSMKKIEPVRCQHAELQPPSKACDHDEANVDANRNHVRSNEVEDAQSRGQSRRQNRYQQQQQHQRRQNEASYQRPTFAVSASAHPPTDANEQREVKWKPHFFRSIRKTSSFQTVRRLGGQIGRAASFSFQRSNSNKNNRAHHQKGTEMASSSSSSSRGEGEEDAIPAVSIVQPSPPSVSKPINRWKVR
mmetsp:Transcript_19730/g.55754  ORF Transcript_19730/g.55754 Transcript_19730/m.55754 type:complete len:596 (-) Transcript_19730:120-1907(-)